jgi:hypothetical protein
MADPHCGPNRFAARRLKRMTKIRGTECRVQLAPFRDQPAMLLSAASITNKPYLSLPCTQGDLGTARASLRVCLMPCCTLKMWFSPLISRPALWHGLKAFLAVDQKRYQLQRIESSLTQFLLLRGMDHHEFPRHAGLRDPEAPVSIPLPNDNCASSLQNRFGHSSYRGS